MQMSIPVLNLVLKWLSQVLIVTSGIYGMFSDLYKQQGPGRKRQLTRAGWINLMTLLTGFTLYAVTDFQDRQGQKRDDEYKAHTIKTQQQLIDSQTEELSYLRHLILEQEIISGWELSWDAPASVIKSVQSQAQSLRGGNDDYLRGCLSFAGINARSGSYGHWTISCVLGLPQGIRNFSFDLAPSDKAWPVFDSVLDTLLSARFAVSQSGGQDLVVLSRLERPDEVSYTGAKVVVTVRNSRVRLSQFEQPVKAILRIETDVIADAPRSVRIRSVDPNLQLDQTFRTNWEKRRVGTKSHTGLPPMDEEEAAQFSKGEPVYALFSGPHELKGSFNKLLFSFEKNQQVAH
jgi:hypothetical protein